jgi:UDP:flavonoid glycosyltransferase YjiC (YdhE family)
VVVTQGTVANLDLGRLIEPALEALVDERVLVVAATGTDREVRGVPANARVTPFVPFELLLPHTDLLITNGGFGGVQQALAHGVPMVLAGQSEDKLESNVRVAATGAAVNLGTDTPSPIDIRKAVDTVLSQSDYRQNAARLQADYAVSDALDVIDTTIRQLVSRTA